MVVVICSPLPDNPPTKPATHPKTRAPSTPRWPPDRQHAGEPAFSGDLEAAREGIAEELAAESARQAEAERQTTPAVWADSFRAGLSGGDRVAARSRLQHVGKPAEPTAA
ncbi:hypothetical protein [Kitasatospora purpeofusca]|uniref:hypothetical protein n=1 Tax=Kitasatospora purpeofusca TaxID=67352 RepID=UPI0036D2A348